MLGLPPSDLTRYKMILTQCAVCATELGLSLGKKCGRCSTRYCGPECQKQHWEGGGHDQLCKKIKKAGGAEQYHANKKYAEAVTVAAEACAEDTKGQTCYICTQALHWKTKEGLVRGCSCRGTAGFAHVSCLAEQAKILVAEAVENNLGNKVLGERWARWHTCSLCEQDYHSVVAHALGWACWKTYLGRPETDVVRKFSMNLLGNGLSEMNRYADALSVQTAQYKTMERYGESDHNRLALESNLASSFEKLGQGDRALRIRRNVYSKTLRIYGEESIETIESVINYAQSLMSHAHFEEPKVLLRKKIPVARRLLGESHDLTIRLRSTYAVALYESPNATPDNLREAIKQLEEAGRITQRVYGGAHPNVAGIECDLQNARAALRAHSA